MLKKIMDCIPEEDMTLSVNGSVICAELLEMKGCKVVKNSNIPDERNAEYYRVRPCSQKVENAARLFAEYLASKEASE